MRILEISTLFPRWPEDGRGPIILQIAQALQNQGADITVISQHGPGSQVSEVIHGVKVYRPRYAWPTRLEVLQDTGGGLPAAWEKKPLTRLLFPFLLAAQTIATIKLAPQHDIIHVHFTIPAMAATLSRPLHGKPVVATVRGSDIYRIPKYPGGKLFNRIALSGCDKITVMSKDLIKASTAIGLPESKFEYIPPPVNIERFQMGPWNQREQLLVYIASLIPRKGPKYLIEAFAKIKKNFPDYQLIMVGTGPEETSLKTLAENLEISQNIQFIPHLSQAEVANLLQKAKIFVLPSLEEALGMVAVEALASGTPVVASRVGGIPEAVPEEAGILVPPADADALADAIQELLSDMNRLQSMSSAARVWAETAFCTHEENASRLLNIFYSLTHESKL